MGYLQMVDTLLLAAALGPDVSCDGWFGRSDGEREEDFGTLMERKIDEVINCDYPGSNYYRLVEDMLAGYQMNPIIVGVNGWEEWGPNSDWQIGNGNHRLAIAIAALLPEVLVCFVEETDDYMLADKFGY